VQGLMAGQKAAQASAEEGRRQQIFEMEMGEAKKLIAQEESMQKHNALSQVGVGTPEGQSMARTGMEAGGMAMGAAADGVAGMMGIKGTGMAPTMARLMKNMAPSTAKIFPGLSVADQEKVMQKEAAQDMARSTQTSIATLQGLEDDGLVAPGSTQNGAQMAQNGDMQGLLEMIGDAQHKQHRQGGYRMAAERKVKDWTAEWNEAEPNQKSAAIIQELQGHIDNFDNIHEIEEQFEETVAKWDALKQDEFAEAVDPEQMKSLVNSWESKDMTAEQAMQALKEQFSTKSNVTILPGDDLDGESKGMMGTELEQGTRKPFKAIPNRPGASSEMESHIANQEAAKQWERIDASLQTGLMEPLLPYEEWAKVHEDDAEGYLEEWVALEGAWQETVMAVGMAELGLDPGDPEVRARLEHVKSKGEREAKSLQERTEKGIAGARRGLLRRIKARMPERNGYKSGVGLREVIMEEAAKFRPGGVPMDLVGDIEAYMRRHNLKEWAVPGQQTQGVRTMEQARREGRRGGD